MPTPFRIALANLSFPPTPDASISMVQQAIEEAAAEGAGIVCFPECYVPGYRAPHVSVPAPDADFQERAWTAIATTAARAKIAVVLPTERIENNALLATALVIDADGTRLGFQDKVQVDPSEDGLYTPGAERRVFQVGPLTFGISICHEGWRYPETVRFAARRRAQLVFHPHYHWAEPDSYRPTTFADPASSFHEKAVLCRAAENTIWFASVNYASEGSQTTSAVAQPDGTLHAYHPYGQHGLLIADIDLDLATGLLASRCRTVA